MYVWTDGWVNQKTGIEKWVYVIDLVVLSPVFLLLKGFKWVPLWLLLHL